MKIPANLSPWETGQERTLVSTRVSDLLTAPGGEIRHGLVLNALMFYAMHRGLPLPNKVSKAVNSR